MSLYAGLPQSPTLAEFSTSADSRFVHPARSNTTVTRLFGSTAFPWQYCMASVARFSNGAVTGGVHPPSEVYLDFKGTAVRAGPGWGI